MISNTDQISLTYIVGGELLAKAGVYQESKIEVKNYKGKMGNWRQLSPTRFKCSTGEEVKVIKPFRTLVLPVYHQAVQHTTMTKAFTDYCLSRPSKPKGGNINRWMRSAEGGLFKTWGRLTDEQKIEAQLKIYCEAMGGTLLNWNI